MPDAVVAEVQAARLAQVRGQADPLEGHAGLTRLKVAAGLAFLDSRLDVEPEDWRLSGLLMETSRAVRAFCATKLSAVTEDKARAGGRLTALRDDAADDERLRLAGAKLARHVWRNHGDGSACVRRCQKDALGTRKTEHDEAAAEALARGWVAEQKYLPSNPGAAAGGEVIALVKGPTQPPGGGR